MYKRGKSKVLIVNLTWEGLRISRIPFKCYILNPQREILGQLKVLLLARNTDTIENTESNHSRLKNLKMREDYQAHLRAKLGSAQIIKQFTVLQALLKSIAKINWEETFSLIISSVVNY
jgi:hypothetical protein